MRSDVPRFNASVNQQADEGGGCDRQWRVEQFVGEGCGTAGALSESLPLTSFW